ncbi:MAG TPA: SlyX family protein [Planctomycetaceae bacterium]|nr:SlyX family protein [Planctomycetaceae bacterium]
MPPMPESPSLPDRVVELELLVTHLQRDLDTLNGVLLDQQKQLDALGRLVARLDDRVTRLGDEDEPSDPVEERPPHY